MDPGGLLSIRRGHRPGYAAGPRNARFDWRLNEEQAAAALSETGGRVPRTNAGKSAKRNLFIAAFPLWLVVKL